jgi:hypothetical protein
MCVRRGVIQYHPGVAECAVRNNGWDVHCRLEASPSKPGIAAFVHTLDACAAGLSPFARFLRAADRRQFRVA